MQPSCQGDEPGLLPVAEAQARIDASLVPVRSAETVALDAALGRVLASDLRSPFDVPPHRNSAMDGFAVRGEDLPGAGVATLHVVGTAWAGHPFTGSMERGTAVRIMTGARMPDEADTVVIQEQAELDGERLRIDASHRRGQNVRQAGEDIRQGSVVLRQGQRLGPAELGLLASLGCSQVPVLRRLRVAVFSTGDEVRDPQQALDPGAIYDSNRFTLRGMLARLGVELLDMGILPDDRQRIEAALAAAAGDADVLITSGGVSAGAADHVKETLEALGQVGFWKIAIRPGRPLAFGAIGNAAFFGLPGNPVAVMVTFYRFVHPALRVLSGERLRQPEPLLDAVCASPLRKRRGRVEYYRAVLERDAEGQLRVRSTGSTGSALLHTMSDANCFIVLPDDAGDVQPGETVQVQPFYGLL